MDNKTKEYRQQISEAFIKSISENPIGWKKEWQGLSQTPMNTITQNRYNGINRFWLSYIQLKKSWDDPRWCTFKQAADKGWKIRKGEKSTQVEYWMPYDKMEKKLCTWDDFRQAQDPNRFLIRPRYFNVFNAHQIDGIPEFEKPAVKEIHAADLIDKISTSMKVSIENDGGDQAYYIPRTDQIHLPLPEVFDSDYAYNATALHELSHSTGHHSRLNRNLSHLFGSADYAYEELIAEISACFMSAEMPSGQTSEHIENHKAYVQSWIGLIQDKPETLIKAIKEAEKSATFLEFHGGLIAEKDYQKVLTSSMEIPSKQKQTVTLPEGIKRTNSKRTAPKPDIALER